MAAPQRRTREMLSVADGKRVASRKPEMPAAAPQPHGAGKPVAAGREKHTAAAGCFADAIAALRIELEMHWHRAIEVETLIAKLQGYANGAEPSAPRKGRGGRPPLDPNDAYRARKAKTMRERRARIKAAVTVTPPPPKAKKKQQPKPKPKPAGTPAAVSTTVPSELPKAPRTPPRAAVTTTVIEETMPLLAADEGVATALPPPKRNPKGKPVFADGYRQPPSSITNWQVDEKTGVSSRERVTSGETPRLRNTPLT